MMGKITLTVEGTTVGTVATGGGVVYTYETTEEDSARLISAMGDFYSSHFTIKPDGEPALEKNIPNIIKVWFKDVVQSAIRLTKNLEQKKLAVQEISVVEK